MTFQSEAFFGRAAWRTVAGAIVVATIVGCGLSLTIALIAVRLDEAGYSARAIGFNTAAGGVATLFAGPFVPLAARRLGVARLLLVSLLVGAVSLALFTVTDDYGAWLVLRFVEGMAVTVMFVLSEFWITTATPEGRRGLAIGIYVTTLAAGFAIGPLVLAVTGTAGNLPFLIAAALFAASTIPLALNARGAPRLEERSGRSLLFFLMAAPAATLAALLHGCIEVAGMSLLPVYALRAGASIAEGALFASLFIVGNSALQLPIGLVADRVDRRGLLVVLALAGLGGAALLAMLGLRSLVLFEVLLLVWGGIVGALYPVGLGELSARFRGADLASANSAYVMTYAAGMLVGPPIIGAGLDWIPPSGFFWAVAGLIALYLIVAAPAVVRRAL